MESAIPTIRGIETSPLESSSNLNMLTLMLPIVLFNLVPQALDLLADDPIDSSDNSHNGSQQAADSVSNVNPDHP